jgi:hypothetical protein
MNIIFGDAVTEIPDSYTVLELDTFRLVSEGTVKTAYCVIEKLPLQEFANLDAYKKVHEDIIRYYKQREWNYCEHAIEGLMGKWNGEVDTFYVDLLSRVKNYKDNDPGPDWDGTRVRI